MTYYFTFFSLLLARLIDSGRGRNGLYGLVLIGLYVFSAFRDQVGCDWFNYLGNFQLQATRSWTEALEAHNPAHWILLQLLHALDLPYFWLNVVTSGIFFAGLHAIARRTPTPLAVLVLAFPVLILNMPMSAVKQAAAIGMLCFAFRAFMDLRLIAFVIWTVLAGLFHSSAFVFLLMLPFAYGRFSAQNVVLASILALPGVAGMLSTDAAEIASSRYIESDLTSGGAMFRVGFTVAVGTLYTFFISDRWKKELPLSFKFISLMALGMMATAVLLPISSVVADRMSYYFAIPQLMIFAALPRLYPSKRDVFLRAAPYAALGVLFLSWTLMSSHYEWCYRPYRMVW